jgi:cytochrome c
MDRSLCGPGISAIVVIQYAHGKLPLGVDFRRDHHRNPIHSHHLSQGEALYLRHCGGCHGWQGQGDGPAASMFGEKAPRLRGAELLAQYSEAELMARILYGRELVIPLDPEALALTEDEVTALVAYL